MKRITVVLLAAVLVLVMFVVDHPGTKAQDGGVADYYRVGAFPRAMAFDGELVWVANWYDNTVTRLWASDGEVFDTLVHDPDNASSPVGLGPVALAWDGEYMWLANDKDNTIYRLNQQGQLVTPFDANDGVQFPVALFYDNANVWVVNQGNNTVMKIEADLATVEGTYDVGDFPTAITWDGTNIWVANGLDNSISVINAITGEPVTEVAVNLFPVSMVFDGIHVWVAHYDGSIVLVNALSYEIDETIEDHPGSPQRPIQLLYAFEHIWIPNAHDGSFTVISADTHATIRAAVDTLTGNEDIPKDQRFPATLGYTDHEIWVIDWLTQSIKVYDPQSIWEPVVINPKEVVSMTPGIWLPSPQPSPTFTILPTPTLCFAYLPPRLQDYEEGVITNRYGDDNWRLRDQPGVTLSEVIGSFPPGTQFKVLDGPACVQNVAWFQVEIEGQTGWMSETWNEVDPPIYALDPIEE